MGCSVKVISDVTSGEQFRNCTDPRQDRAWQRLRKAVLPPTSDLPLNRILNSKMDRGPESDAMEPITRRLIRADTSVRFPGDGQLGGGCLFIIPQAAVANDEVNWECLYFLTES